MPDSRQLLFDFDNATGQHYSRLEGYQREIQRIYDDATREAAMIAGTIRGANSSSKAFTFAQYPQTRARIDQLMQSLNSEVLNKINDRTNIEWDASNAKNELLAIGMNGGKALTPEQMLNFGRKNYGARDAFKARQVDGLDLSERVWKYNTQFKNEIEMAVGQSILEGVPASRLAAQTKAFLQQPDKLFRRVRDAQGNLQLSRNARLYNPGQGVYRSSYKNALRLAATEINMAYRSADFERWQQMEFVLGIEIQLSNNHTIKDSKTGEVRPLTDICDELAGRYPKTFHFTGWHPWCRCHAVPVLADQADFVARQKEILAGKKRTPYTGVLTDLPTRYTGWIQDNAERIARAQSIPYFLRDNAAMIKQATRTARAAETVKAVSIIEAAKVSTINAQPPIKLQPFNMASTATTESMMADRRTIEIINNAFDPEFRDVAIKDFIANPKNYKENTYFRVEGGTGAGYGGVGNGLYLGRDPRALANFYDIEGSGLLVSRWSGNPRWLNLMDPEDMGKFESAIEKRGMKLVNSSEVGAYVKSLGFDGIRYFDVMATGEEFVLFETSQVVKVVKGAEKAAAKLEAGIVKLEIRSTESMLKDKAFMQEYKARHTSDGWKPTMEQTIEDVKRLANTRAESELLINGAIELGIERKEFQELINLASDPFIHPDGLKWRNEWLAKRIKKEERAQAIKDGTIKARVKAAPKYTMTDQRIAALEKKGWYIKVEPKDYNEIMDGFDLGQFDKDMEAIAKNSGFTFNAKTVEKFGDRIRVEMSDYNNDMIQLVRDFTQAKDGARAVEHTLFELDDALQGRGLSKKIFAKLYDQYKTAGIKTIDVHANITVGGYCWGKYGFSATMPKQLILNFEKNIRIGELVKESRSAITIINDFIKANPGQNFPMELLANEKWAKDLLLNKSWYGTIDLTNAARRKVFETYLTHR